MRTVHKLGLAFAAERAFQPFMLFSEGHDGALLAPYRSDMYFQDAGITPADEVGEAIGRIVDQTGNGYNANQTTAAAKPTLGTVPRGGRRNRVLNGMVGLAAGSPGTAPTTYAMTTTTGVFTRTLSGPIVVEGRTGMTVRYQFSGAGTATIQFSDGNAIAALIGQQWSNSAYVQLVAGAYTNISATRMGISENDSGGGFLAGDTTNFTATSTLTRRSHSRTLTNASTAFVVGTLQIVATGAADITLFIAQAQVERSATPTDAQVVTNAYQITESGVPSILMPYYDGGDFLSLGVQAVGTADLFFEAGVPQWCAGAFSVINNAGNAALIAKASATAGTKTLQVSITSGGFFLINSRGTEASYGVGGGWNNGLLQVWLLYWDGAALELFVNDAAPVPVTVGAAAEEAQNITLGCRTESSPGTYFTGFFDILGIRAGTLSTAQRTQLMQYLNQYYRGVSI